MEFDRKRVIEDMQKDSGVQDFIPITIRFHGNFYTEISKFCKATGIKKAVLIRRVCEIGWELVKETGENGSTL